MRPVRLIMTGQMGAGKSVGADFYVHVRGASRWSRTELMKRLAHAVADGVGDADEILARIFPDKHDRQDVTEELIEYVDRYEPEPGKPRVLYQDITQICQDRDPLCFERELKQRIARAGSTTFCLVDDVRSRAAFDFFTENGYRSVRIHADEPVRRRRMLQRDGYLPSEDAFTHPSETELTGVDHDYHFVNNEDNPAELFRFLDRVLADLRGGTLPAVDYDTLAAQVMDDLKTRRP